MLLNIILIKSDIPVKHSNDTKKLKKLVSCYPSSSQNFLPQVITNILVATLLEIGSVASIISILQMIKLRIREFQLAQGHTLVSG